MTSGALSSVAGVTQPGDVLYLMVHLVHGNPPAGMRQAKAPQTSVALAAKVLACPGRKAPQYMDKNSTHTHKNKSVSHPGLQQHTKDHGGGRQPMCDPEGCSTVWGAVGGGGGTPTPLRRGGGGPLPPPLVDPNPAPFPAGPVQARKHTKLTRCTVNGHCFAALQHFQSSIECCLEFAQRPLLPLVTNHRHICREAKGATDI